jgi:hypothetical protein
MSPPGRNPSRTVADAPEDLTLDVFSTYRHLLGHVVVTVLLLILLAAMAYWLLLT